MAWKGMLVRSVALLIGLGLLTAPLFAQIPTGSLAGRLSHDGQPVAGALVTVTSSALQGSRSVRSTTSGDYNLALLPPGDYQITVEAQGFEKVQRTARIASAQDTRLDLELAIQAMTEEIVVSGLAETTISTQPAAAVTFDKKVIDELPVERTIRDTALLAPGVADTGPGAARARGLTINGSQSYENLFLINGVVVNENLRGQAFPLFIEDAVQETTITTSAISAEYGRFAGGVVNTITKSGGNELHGSLRTSLTNDKWTAPTPLTKSRTDEINKRYEGTLGGWFWKDRLWYFLAGRSAKTASTSQTVVTRIPYANVDDEKRYEGKLTLTPYTGHSLVASYIRIDEDQNGNSFGSILDTASLVNRSLPQKLLALNYSGIFTPEFYGEVQYSRRDFTFENSGSRFTDRTKGTLLVDAVTGYRWNSPTFCGVCLPEERNNKDFLVKGSWFLSTERGGSHDLDFGYDTFDDIRKADNHQSGSDFRIFITNTLVNGTNLLPQLVSGSPSTIIQWNPILITSQGTNFRTNSLFVNDKWRPTERLSVNVGLRYDKNDGENSQGQAVAKDSRISPRLAAAYDLAGDGDWIVNAGFGRYVNALANTQGDSSSQAGNPATYQWFYRGPSINAGGPTVSTDDALAQIFAWFDAQGGTSNTSNLRLVSIPGGTTVIRGSLDSPYTDEVSLGLSKRLGSRGQLRADLVHRQSKAFYAQRVDLSTGQVTTPSGRRADLALVVNTDDLERKYDALHLQGQYRFSKVTLGGLWSISSTRGNVNGETAASGPVSAVDLAYPEYRQRSWNNPSGDLATDQRHRARVWALIDVLNRGHHRLNVSAMESYASGVPYGAVGAVDSRPYVTNPGYALPPSSVAYYYTARDAFHTDAITATDLALNYSFVWKTLGRDIEVFVQPEILNVFDEKGVLNVNTSVLDATTTSSLQKFNPFTTKPVEGTNWKKGSSFGKPVAPTDYQLPRTFRFSVGIRF